MFHMNRFGSTFSLFDGMNIGSTLSLRSIARIGSCLSIGQNTLGHIAIGSEGKVANMYFRSGVHSNWAWLSDHIHFPSELYNVPGQTGGHLHGEWFADTTLQMSDRRVKTNIKPLETQLRRNQELVRNLATPKGSAPEADQEAESGVSWILRELRPVSFRFKSATDTKRLVQNRFGFVAQEVERLSPNMVHAPFKDEPKGILYQDFLAVLTLAMQEQQERLNRQGEDVQRAQEEVQEFLDQAEILDRLLDAFEANETQIRQLRELSASMSD